MRSSSARDCARNRRRRSVIQGEDEVEGALSAWGRNARIDGPLGEGNRNRVWAIRIGGVRCVARLSSRLLPALNWEVDLLRHLQGVGMRVPLPIPATDGRLVVGGVIVFDWLEGEPPASEADWRLVYQELRWLHELTRDWPQRPDFRSTRQLLEEERGGDVRLDLMPPDAVDRIRAAWRALSDEPMSAVHGDPGRGNVVIDRGRVGLIDWDEARVDISLLDLADLPLDLTQEIEPSRLERARRAADAWEAANGWVAEPEYARRRLARFYPPPPNSP